MGRFTARRNIRPTTCRSWIRRRTRCRSSRCRSRIPRCRNRSGPDMPPASSRWSRRPIGARKSSGTREPTTTTPCSTRRAGSGSPPPCAAWITRRSASKGSDHPSAKLFPLEKSARQVAMLDPKTMKYSFIDTCFATHHLQFGYDANDTLWLSGTGPVAGWVNTKMFDETGDAAKSQGWSPFVLDTNGNGKRDDYVEPNAAARSDQGQADRPGFGTLCGDAVPGRRLDLVHRRRRSAARRRSCASIRPTGLSEIYNVPAPGVRNPRRRYRQERRGLGVARRAVTSAASTAASARARSMGRTPPAIIAPRAGRSTSIPAPASKASARTAPSRATTPGSTSTTRSGSARTSRCRPPISMTASWR